VSDGSGDIPTTSLAMDEKKHPIIITARAPRRISTDPKQEAVPLSIRTIVLGSESARG
jgi:hypothetical protein